MEKIDVRDSLKAVIIARGYNQAALARKANMTPSQLNGVLNKKRKIDANEFMSICDIIGITPESVRNYKATN